MTASAPSSRQRWLVPVVVVVLSVTVGGGLLARELYHRPDQPAGDTSAPASATSSASSGQPTATGAVGMTPDAASHPQAEAVRKLLETYFEAINTKDYQQWTAVVSAQRIAEQTPSTWRAGVRSTKDSDALVYRIERGAGSSLRVLVGFTSVQKPEDAPLFFREPCIRWRLVLPIVADKSGLKIDSIDNVDNKGLEPEHEKC